MMNDEPIYNVTIQIGSSPKEEFIVQARNKKEAIKRARTIWRESFNYEHVADHLVRTYGVTYTAERD